MSFTYQFNTTCAAVYGVPEAVFIHQLYFWCRVNEKNGRNLHDGRYWSYNSMKALREIFDFWSPSQLETVIKNCRKKGAILTANYCTDPRDRTLSYTITDSVKCIYEKSEMSDGDFRNAFPKSKKCIMRANRSRLSRWLCWRKQTPRWRRRERQIENGGS